MNDFDETFLQECLSVLRDGETVTIQGSLARHAHEWMAQHGATEEELSRLVIAGQRPTTKRPRKIRPETRTVRDQVRKFHAANGIVDRVTPGPIEPKFARLRAALIAEEAFETIEAIFWDNREYWQSLKAKVLTKIVTSEPSPNLPSLADGLADLDYVVEGTRLAFGIDGRPIAAEVHRTNMAKLDGPRLPSGKIGKPEGWTPPDIEGELRKHGWEP